MQKKVPLRPDGRPSPARNWRSWALGCALLVVTLAAYYPALHGGMVWDDDRHVTAAALRSWHGLFRIWSDVRATLQYYPLLHSTFWIEHRLWGDTTTWYHLANVVEHVGAALMLASVLRRLAVPGAYLAAIIFALHPVHVETAAWISEQKNTLSTLFYLTAAMAYLRFDQSRKPGWYGAAGAAFVLALLSKTVTATLPGALLVIFWWRRGRLSWKSDVLPLAPFFVVGAGAAGITAWWELDVNKCVGPDFQFTFVERVLIAGRSIWFELGKLFWPTHLTFMYPRWEIDSNAWWQYLFPVGVVALAATLWLIRRWSRAPLAAFLFFCGTLFPVLGFFNLYTFRYSFVANHYQYVASVGPIALTAALMVAAGSRLPGKIGALAISGVAVIVLGAVTHAGTGKFASMEALLQDTIREDPESWFAYTNLGSLLLDQGRVREARVCFERALEVKPGFAVAYNNLGNTWLREGDLARATSDHRKAVELQPDYAEAYNNLGIDLAKAGEYEEAIANYQRALELDPAYAMAHYNLANALVRTGDAAGAERHYLAAIATKDDFALAYYALGLQLVSEGRPRDADAVLRTAFRLMPDFAQGYFELGNLQLQLGQTAAAILSYSNALRTQPGYAEAHCNLGVAFVRENRIPEAIEEYRRALAAKPTYAIAMNNLGFALERQGRMDEATAEYRRALAVDPANQKAQENLQRVLGPARTRQQ